MLEINNLTCGYDARFSLTDINIKIKENEFLGIIGPNGSGKTTLFRAITKIIHPRNGGIFLDGIDLDEIDFKGLARKLAVVSQNFDIDMMMSVEEFVLLGRIPYRQRIQLFESKDDGKIVNEAMVLTDTLEFRKRLMGSLSGGERQLVYIARALAQKPKLLLLDEPTNQLDIAHQVKIMDLIKRLNKERNITVVIVLHDLNLASEYCDRLVLINNGRVHKIGSPCEVLTYQTIEEVYKTVVLVKENPLSKKPYVFLVSEGKGGAK
ncbi:MAG: ABC transporter ATP-binding protein [bacterium]|nr:ABC transporter ATP-binding protein [bacterium]